jgi:hypothetical protein
VRRIALGLAGLALGYIVWDRVEAHRFSRAVDAIPASEGLIVKAWSLQAPATAEQREAASLYAQAAELANERDSAENRRASRLDVDAPGGTEIPLDEIRANYRGNDPAMPLLDRATSMDFHGFETGQRGESPFGRVADRRRSSPLERGLEALGSFACLRADLASSSGDADTAVAALVPCIRLQRTLLNEQARSMHGVRILGSLRIFFRHISPSDTALVTLQHAIESWPEEDPMLRAALLDRARFVEIARGHIFDPFAMASARRALPAYDEAIAITQRPWSERWTAVDQELTRFRARRPPGLVARLTDPFGMPFTTWTPISLRQSAYELAARRIAALAIAVERDRRAHNGVVPASVNAPEDPFSGQPLIFRRDSEGYVIYGLDTNRKDDGGVLYGFGAAPATHIGPQSPRDFGIRIPVNPARPAVPLSPRS